MADIQSNIRVDIDTSGALASIKALQREISAFQTSMARGGAVANAQASQLRQNLINTLNASGQFAASVQKISSTTENFTTALEKNKMSLGQYFRYAGGASKSFGKFFKSEMDTIEKVAISRVKTLQTQYIKMGRDANGALKAIAVRPLTLDMKNLGTQTAMAAQKQQLLNQLLKQGSTNLLNFGKNTQWAGRQLMVGFTIPLATLGMAATKTFKQMEEQAIKFKRVYGDSFTASAETDKMLKQVQDLATEFTKYGVAVKDTMDLAAQAAASGKVGADLLAQVTSATRLAVLGNVDQQKALETTISLTNAFGTATEELGNKINFLNAVENQTVTSIDDLTTAIPKAAPVIKQLGGDVEDLAFFLTAMKEGGVNASEGANALKSGLASLINPTKKASSFLKGFGVDVNKIVESNKGDVSSLVVDFAKALDTLDPLNRARAIEQMFGKFQFARMSTLFKNVIQDGTQASRVLDLMKQSSVGLAALSQKELRQIQSSPLYKFQKAIEDFKKELAPVGEEFMKAVTPLINFGKDVLANFNKLEPGMKQFIVNFTGIVAGLGPVFLMTFGLIANGVANVIKGFAFVKNSINKVSSSSTVLGETTNYMTQEQLKAAAVAASLEQSHTKLTQAFTVERKSLELLTAAYTKATAQQAKFGATPGKPKSPKKYAGGVYSVPGPKGAGDVVPAMLSPGEAVIPAKQASRYHGLIKSIVANNIPGYEDSNIEPEKKPASTARRKKVTDQSSVEDIITAYKDKDRSAVPAIVNQTRSMEWETYKAEQDAVDAEVEKIIKERRMTGKKAESFRNNYRGKVAAHLGGVGIEPITMGGMQTTAKRFNSKTVTPDLRAINQGFAALVELAKGVPGKKYKTGSSIGDLLADKSKVEALAAQVGLDPKTLTTELRRMDPKRKGGSQYPQSQNALRALLAVSENAGPNSNPGRVTSAALRQRLSTFGQTGTREAAIASGGLRYDPKLDEAARKQEDTRRERFSVRADAAAGTRGTTKPRKPKVVAKNEAAVKAETTSVNKKTKEVNKSTKVSRKVYTMEERLAAATEKVTKARQAIADPSSRKRKFNKDEIAAQNLLTYGNPKGPTAEQRQSRKDQEAALKAERVALAQQRQSERAKSKKPGMFSRAAGQARAAKVGKFTGGMRGVGIGSAVSIGGSMLASSIPDPTISTVVGGVSIIAGLFPKLSTSMAAFLPHIAVAAAAIGGLALVVDIATREERKRLKQAKDRAEAVTLTTSKKQVFADFFGSSLSSKYFQAPKANADMSNQEAMAVQELKLNEAFKNQYATTITALKEGTNEQVDVMLKSLSLGLSADFAPDQIAVIIQTLKEEAGKTSLSIDFSQVDVKTQIGRKNVVDLVKESRDSLKTEGNIDSINMLTDRLAELKRAKDLIKSGVDSVKTSFAGDVNSKNIDGLIEDEQRKLDVNSGAIGEAKIQDFASKSTNAITALRVAYDKGEISQKAFSGSIEQLREEYKALQPYQQYMAGVDWFETLPYPQDVKDSMSAIEDASLKFDLYTLSISNSSAALDLFNQYQAVAAQTNINPQDKAAGIQAILDKIAELIKLQTEGDEDVEKGLTVIQKKYEAITKLLDNYQKGLEIISLKEDEINKKYEEKLDALDKIQEANDNIAKQQQDQLDIAEKITSGDVAGAARAVQQARQNSSDIAFQNQRSALELAQNNEKDALTDPSGRTRKVLEDLIGKKEMEKLLLEFKNGDKVNAATGGHIRGKGTGTSDSIPAMLSNGEYVIRAKAAKALGIDTLDKMNHAEKFMLGGPVNIAKYAKGGPVNIAKYAKGGKAKSSASTLANPMDIIGRGFTTVMDDIYQNLFGGWMNNVRKGKPSVPTLEDAGTMALNALPIPGLKGAKGAIAKMFGKGTKAKGKASPLPDFDFDWNALPTGPVPDILGGAGMTLFDKIKNGIGSKLVKPVSGFMGQMMGSAKSGLSRIPELFKSIASSRSSAKTGMSPIINGIFGKTGATEGVTSAGTGNVNGMQYFFKKLGDLYQNTDVRATPQMNPNTALQEYLVSNVLQRAGMNVPDLKFFPEMSSLDNGIVLGSKKLPGLDVMRNYEKTMKELMKNDPEAYRRSIANFLSNGADEYAANDAVANAILQNPDVHPGNLMFDVLSGKVSSLDFGILNVFGSNAKKSLADLLNVAGSHAKGIRNMLFSNGLPASEAAKIDLLSGVKIPHNVSDIPFAPPGSDQFATLIQKTADAKPMAQKIADALGFDMSMPGLPADFASKNPILVEAMNSLRASNMDPEMLKFLDPQSQQILLERVFENVREILSAKNATFNYANGGMVAPKYFAKGGMVGMYAKGGDVVPSMLTPGEFVVSQPAVKNFGVDNLRAINNGTHSGDSMYNYNVSLSVNGSNANADDIARKVMQQIKRIDSQRVGGVRA